MKAIKMLDGTPSDQELKKNIIEECSELIQALEDIADVRMLNSNFLANKDRIKEKMNRLERFREKFRSKVNKTIKSTT